MSTGEVVAGARGDGTGDLAITGEAITTAARIQSLAGPGEILLDEATVRGGRDRLAVDDRGSVVLRGQSSVVHVYALTGEVGLSGRAGIAPPRRARSSGGATRPRGSARCCAGRSGPATARSCC